MTTHRIVSIQGDGHCLFRSVYFGLKEKPATAEIIYKMRRAVCDHVAANWQRYQPFLIEFDSIQDYEREMKRNTWGGEPEIYALVQIIKCTICIYDMRFRKWVKYKHKNSIKAIYLRYTGGNHYDCILRK